MQHDIFDEPGYVAELDDRPSEAPRGSWERIEDYRRRYESGMEIFHPNDSDEAIISRRGFIDYKRAFAPYLRKRPL